jgi:cobalt-zinc-cadmium efflux system protein
VVGRETRREQKRQMRARGRRALVVAFCVFALLAVVEAVGGLLAGSLALLADSGHVAGDALAIAVALAAARLADRPANRRKTFGYLRAEILAAQVNGVYLTVVAAWTIWQAATRLVSPEHVDGLPMALIGVLGLLANGGVIILLRRGGDGVSVRSALLDSLSDALGAAGAIVAGCVIATTGWRWADPIAALMIAALIAAAALRLLREVLDVLLESAPGRLDVEEIERTMLAVSGVAAVHDTHVWTLTSGFVAMSGHAELGSGADEHAVLDALTAMLSDRFGIDHVTIQPETSRHAAACCDADCDTDRQRGVAIAAGKRV